MAIDTMDPTTALNWGPFIQAAFDQFRRAPDEINPGVINLPGGYTLVRTIQMTDFIIEPSRTPKFYGFLAIGGDPETQVIAVRGTSTITEWWDNLHFGQVPFSRIPNGGNVAEGFYDIYKTLATMDPAHPEAGTDNDLSKHIVRDLPLVVTGHSLGGALATLLVADLTINAALHPQAWTCKHSAPSVTCG